MMSQSMPQTTPFREDDQAFALPRTREPFVALARNRKQHTTEGAHKAKPYARKKR